MKDFDARRRERQNVDREFVIGGETFVVKAGVRPEALAAYEQITEDSSVAETLEIVDGLIVSMLDPADEAHTRWRTLRERDDDPITVEDLQELAKWLVEVQTGRPTVSPSESSLGLARTGTALTGDSSSPEAAAA